MSGKPEGHHHTCSEAKDHHCPECCPCKCCSRHSRTYETHRRSSHRDNWEEDYKDAEEWRRWREVDERAASSPSDLNQASEASLRDPNKVDKARANKFRDFYMQRRTAKDQPSNEDIDDAGRSQVVVWVKQYRSNVEEISLSEKSPRLRIWLKTKLSGADDRKKH